MLPHRYIGTCLNQAPIRWLMGDFIVNTLDLLNIVQSKFCEFTEIQFLRFLTANMECQVYTERGSTNHCEF